MSIPKGKKIIIILFPLITVMFVYFLSRSKISQEPQKKYNVVIIVSDALRFDSLGCNGGEAKTPNINWLAKNGTHFLNAYSTSPWTTPSAVSMLTGNYASTYKNGIRKIIKKNVNSKKVSYFVPDSQLLFPEVLKKLNYNIMFQLYNFNAMVANNLQGFRQFGKYENLTNTRKKIIEKITGIGNYNHFYELCYPTIDFILKNQKQNFFALIWITDPHSPYNPIGKYKKKITIDITKLRKKPEYYQKITNFHPWENKKINKIEIEYIKKLYIAEVESVDERMGYIINALKYKKLLDKTHIIFTSDHGESFGQHGLYEHGTSYYEELIHIPLIHFGPKIKKNLRIKTPVSILDLMPTIKGLLGVSYNSKFQGRSYESLLKGKTIESRDLFIECLDIYGGIKKRYKDCLISDNFKLITLKKNRFELYNLPKDPHEFNNLLKPNRKKVNKIYKKIKKIRVRNKKQRKIHLKNQPRNQIIKTEEIIKRLKSLGYI